MAKDDLDDILKEVSAAIGDVNAPVLDPKKENLDKAPVDGTAFPTEMRCSQVFDQLLKCYSIGGQIRHYYRHGELSYCMDKRSKLMFCLKTKLNTEEVRKEKISKWYKEKLAEQMAQRRTSEQVWASREEPLRRPFREDAEKYLDEGSN